MKNRELLLGHLSSQRLAFRAASAIRKEIKEGWTELQASELMDVYLRDHGVQNFFHRSFAWFGDRTKFEGFKKYRDFLPSNRVYSPELAVILDTAPVVNGFVADIGYSYCALPSAEYRTAESRLSELRGQIREWFLSTSDSRVIWKNVEEQLKQWNYENCYKKYPFSVLGHRVYRFSKKMWPDFLHPFSVHAYGAILFRGLFSQLLGPGHAVDLQGLWAIEPHLGGKDFGMKFEEILCVEGDRVEWLDPERTL